MDKAIQDYIDAVSDERRLLFDRLHRMVMGLYPDAETFLSYQIPTYRVKSGRLSLGYWKNGVSLYTTGPQYIARFKAGFPAIKTGHASINFKVTDVIPEAALKAVIQHAIDNPEQP
jgi:uncharacterized protein YdhG (YjbR/CyaY superfamily)